MQDKKAVGGVCVRCFGTIWLAQYCGFKVLADPTPISIAEEIECIYQKRKTYGVSRWLPSFYLEWRSIRNVGKQYEFVLATHQCGSPQSLRHLPSYWPVTQPATPNY